MVEFDNKFPFITNGEKQTQPTPIIDVTGEPRSAYEHQLQEIRLRRTAEALWRSGALPAMRFLEGHLRGKDHASWLEIGEVGEKTYMVSQYFDPQPVSFAGNMANAEPPWRARGVRIVEGPAGRKIEYLESGSVKAGVHNPSGEPAGWRVLNMPSDSNEELKGALKEARRRSTPTFVNDIHGQEPGSLQGVRDRREKTKRVKLTKKGSEDVIQIIF